MKTLQFSYNNNINNFLYFRIKEANIWKHLQYTNIYTIDYTSLIKIYQMK